MQAPFFMSGWLQHRAPPECATARRSIFSKDLVEFDMCRCFPERDPTSRLLPPLVAGTAPMTGSVILQAWRPGHGVGSAMVSHPRGIIAVAHIMTMHPIDEIQRAMAELRRDDYRRARACLCRQREANVKRVYRHVRKPALMASCAYLHVARRGGSDLRRAEQG